MTKPTRYCVSTWFFQPLFRIWRYGIPEKLDVMITFFLLFNQIAQEERLVTLLELIMIFNGKK